jgi:hypothetical protein
VLRGTLEELVALRLWPDAYRLIWNFRYDVGPRHAMGEAWTVARRLGGSVFEANRHEAKASRA